jgi:hypothetical protein
VVVSVGWSDRLMVHKNLSGYNYAALGNCYSLAGITYIILNLAHNYQINSLIHMARLPLDNNVETTNHLLRIWDGGSCPGIPDYVTRAVTSRVNLQVVDTLIDLKDALLGITDYPVETHLYPDLQYPIELPEISVTPKRYQSGFSIRGNSILDGWVDALKLVRENGTEVRGPHGVILDIGNLQVTVPMVSDLGDTPIPTHMTRDALSKYLLTVTSDEGGTDSYTYGQRIGNQLDREVSVFKRNPNHNRSVISLWDPIRDFDSQNPPCLISIGYKIRGGVLYCHALFRSQDIGSGWFPNVYALNALANKFRFLLGDSSLELGTITINSESAHIYQNTLPQIDNWIRDNSKRGLQLDPLGDFVVKFGDGSLHIDHYDRAGIFRNTYPNPCAILREMPQIDTGHYGYLSGEFARAQILGEEFRQDKY